MITLRRVVRTPLIGALLVLAGLVSAGAAPRGAAFLYALSVIPTPSANDVTARVSVLDPVSGQVRQSFPAGGDVDAVVSPDGNRLYVAGDLPALDGGLSRDFLTAFDRRSGRPLWRAQIQDHVKYHEDTLSTLVASPDGRDLYVYSFAVPALASDVNGRRSAASVVSWWLQRIDAATGKILPETILLPDCGSAAFQLVPGSSTLIASCFELGDLRFLNLATRHLEAKISLAGPGSLTGGAVSPDGRWFYAVTTALQVAVVDVARRAIARQVTLEPKADRKDLGFVALSADGTRLVVGENVQAIAGTDTDAQLQAYDTQTWRKVAEIDVGRPLYYVLASAPAGHVVYALGSIALKPPWTPGTIVYAIDLDRQAIRPFLERPDEDVLRILAGP